MSESWSVKAEIRMDGPLFFPVSVSLYHLPVSERGHVFDDDEEGRREETFIQKCTTQRPAVEGNERRPVSSFSLSCLSVTSREEQTADRKRKQREGCDQLTMSL